MEKLEPVDSEDHNNDTSSIPIDLLVEPFERLMAKSPTKVVRTRVKEMLFDERLLKWGYSNANESDGEEEENTDTEDEEWTGFD